jgi:hypothetical protein
MKVKLAAALLQAMPYSIIPYEDRKKMTADQIISLFHLDHYPILHAFGGPDEPWNLMFVLRSVHIRKTKQDIAALAKSKRIADRLNRVTAEPSPPRGKTKWPKRKILSRPFRRLRAGLEK